MAAALAIAVGLAFADASIVVLGLPDIYADFGTTIVGVSWVITIYALAVAAVAAAVAPFHRRLRPLHLVVAGVAVFAVASAAAALAPGTGALLTARAAQGAGAGLLLAGALPVLGALLGSPERGRRLWATAGTAGAALGPAVGGILTQVFTWRAIFVAQAPLAALALLAATAVEARGLRREHPAVPARRGLAADLALACVFAAAVGALFLAVLLVVEVWRFEPLAGAAAVSTLPIAALAVRPLAPRLSPLARALTGGALLAGGLVALSQLPGADAWWLAAALVPCGAGFGLATDLLDPAATAGPGVRAAARTTAARHAGLVVGLALVAPLLAGSLDHGARDAAYVGTQSLLDAKLPLDQKIPVALALRDAIAATPAGQVPDLGAVFADRSDAARTAGAGLTGAIDDVLTRAFRGSFLVAAAVGALGVLPALAVAAAARRPGGPGGRGRTGTAAAGGALAVVCLSAAVLLAGEQATGARDVGRYRPVAACTAPPSAYPGSGLDGAVQRIGLDALQGAACELHTTRERLVLSLDSQSKLGDVAWDRPTLERALKAGAHRAIDAADERGSLPGWGATALGWIVDRAPIDWLVEHVSLPSWPF